MNLLNRHACVWVCVCVWLCVWSQSPCYIPRSLLFCLSCRARNGANGTLNLRSNRTYLARLWKDGERDIRRHREQAKLPVDLILQVTICGCAPAAWWIFMRRFQITRVSYFRARIIVFSRLMKTRFIFTCSHVGI